MQKSYGLATDWQKLLLLLIGIEVRGLGRNLTIWIHTVVGQISPFGYIVLYQCGEWLLWTQIALGKMILFIPTGII